MYEPHKKELFSFAYAAAVIGAAGYNITQPKFGYNSVDFSIRGTDDNVPLPFPCLDVQLKCTSGQHVRGSELRFRLPMKNYNDLRRRAALSRILVVVTVPADIKKWINCSPTELILRRCGYWRSLRSLPDVPNTANVTVPIPLANRFTVESLTGLIGTLEAGGEV